MRKNMYLIEKANNSECYSISYDYNEAIALAMKYAKSERVNYIVIRKLNSQERKRTDSTWCVLVKPSDTSHRKVRG